MFDQKQLRMKMIEKDETSESLSSFLGISISTFRRKLCGKNDFVRSEIQAIRIHLRLTEEELITIFLQRNLRKRNKQVEGEKGDNHVPIGIILLSILTFFIGALLSRLFNRDK